MIKEKLVAVMTEDAAKIAELGQKLNGDLKEEEVKSCVEEISTRANKLQDMISKSDVCNKEP